MGKFSPALITAHLLLSKHRVEWKSYRLFSSPGGSNAGLPPSLSHHTSGSLTQDLESQIVFCNVCIAADAGAGNWLTSCWPAANCFAFKGTWVSRSAKKFCKQWEEEIKSFWQYLLLAVAVHLRCSPVWGSARLPGRGNKWFGECLHKGYHGVGWRLSLGHWEEAQCLATGVPGIKLMVDGPEPDTIAGTQCSSWGNQTHMSWVVTFRILLSFLPLLHRL